MPNQRRTWNKVTPAKDPWRARMTTRFSTDRKDAEKILREHGFSIETARGAVMELRAYGAIVQLRKDAPTEFNDPNHPCYYAVRLLALEDMVLQADPASLQVGRRWGQWVLGTTLPEIAKAVRDGHLAQHRGPGGSVSRDMARTLQVLVREGLAPNRTALLKYLQSDKALDRFSATDERTVFITGVEIDETKRLVTYEDQERIVRKIRFDSLDRKLRTARKDAKR